MDKKPKACCMLTVVAAVLLLLVIGILAALGSKAAVIDAGHPATLEDLHSPAIIVRGRRFVRAVGHDQGEVYLVELGSTEAICIGRLNGRSFGENSIIIVLNDGTFHKVENSTWVSQRCYWVPE